MKPASFQEDWSRFKHPCLICWPHLLIYQFPRSAPCPFTCMGKLKREHESKKSLVLRKEEMGSANWAQVASCVEAWREPAKDSDRGRRHPVERHQACLLDLKVILRSHSEDRPSARPAREGACLHGNSESLALPGCDTPDGLGCQHPRPASVRGTQSRDPLLKQLSLAAYRTRVAAAQFSEEVDDSRAFLPVHHWIKSQPSLGSLSNPQG